VLDSLYRQVVVVAICLQYTTARSPHKSFEQNSMLNVVSERHASPVAARWVDTLFSMRQRDQ
jgi:hypothetical protein